jgi:hypothetical protein
MSLLAGLAPEVNQDVRVQYVKRWDGDIWRSQLCTVKGERIMKAMVFHGPGKRSWEDKPKPEIIKATDAIVRITHTTICGTDLHILKG